MCSVRMQVSLSIPSCLVSHVYCLCGYPPVLSLILCSLTFVLLIAKLQRLISERERRKSKEMKCETMLPPPPLLFSQLEYSHPRPTDGTLLTGCSPRLHSSLLTIMVVPVQCRSPS